MLTNDLVIGDAISSYRIFNNSTQNYLLELKHRESSPIRSLLITSASYLKITFKNLIPQRFNSAVSRVDTVYKPMEAPPL